MDTNERFDESITGWLEQTAPARLPDRVLEATFARTRGDRQQVGWRAGLGRMHLTRSVAALGGAAAAVTVATALALGSFAIAPSVGGPSPSGEPQSPFTGTWFSTSDPDGGTQTMAVRAAQAGGVEIVVTDTIATVCSLTPSTMTGAGRIEGATKLVIPSPVYTCDDGSEPRPLSGPPLQEQLRNLTFVRDAQAGNLADNFGGVWTRSVAATPSAGPASSPSEAIEFDFPTSIFVSPINGYSFEYIDRGGLAPAKKPWDPDNQPPIAGHELRVSGAPWLDQFDLVETGLGLVFYSASTEIPDGVAVDGWVDASVAKYLSEDCHVPRDPQAAFTVDGHAGRISECGDEVAATVVLDGRLYLFILAHDRPDGRPLFDAFAATIRLTPETAVDFPKPDTTFVSPTYGYSFEYYDRGGLAPATEIWDPANQPLADRNLDARFDGVETGLGAYFEGASTEIPDGVSIDGWVDEYVTPVVAGGCGVPRSQQAEITIDGQPGRIAECDHTEATVVAGGRLYLFIGPGQSSRNRAWFDAWIATIDLRPEEAP